MVPIIEFLNDKEPTICKWFGKYVENKSEEIKCKLYQMVENNPDGIKDNLVNLIVLNEIHKSLTHINNILYKMDCDERILFNETTKTFTYPRIEYHDEDKNSFVVIKMVNNEEQSFDYHIIDQKKYNNDYSFMNVDNDPRWLIGEDRYHGLEPNEKVFYVQTK
jgi:hypothetical protein